MRVLDLFSGIGGFSLGLERAGMETVAFCEIDPFCQQVLRKHWPGVPIYDDITTLAYAAGIGLHGDGECTGRQTRRKSAQHDGGQRSLVGIDVICGGFPCQPFSQAGKRRGAADHRALWPEMFRLIREVQPTIVIGENVTGLISMELDTVLSDLESEGYACQTFVIPACGVDAPHRRDRVWIVGHRDRKGEPVGAVDAEVAGLCGNVAHASSERRQQDARGAHGDETAHEGRAAENGHQSAGNGEDVPNNGPRSGQGQGREISRGPQPSRWLPEPPVGRVANGIPRRVDRLRALGNAVVPQVVEVIGRAIMAVER